MEWKPIEIAPKYEAVMLYGYNVNGQAAPGGPYKSWFVTVGEVNNEGGAADLLNPGCDCVRGGEMEHPTHWMHFPEPPRGN